MAPPPVTIFTSPVPTCPMCGSPRRARFCSREGGTYVACRACRTRYVDPRPRDDWLQVRLEEFAPPPGGESATWPDTVSAERWKVDLLEAYHPPGKRVLDVGSGTGAFVEAVIEAGYEGEGYDLSPGVAAAAQRDHGVTVHSGPLAALDRDYDVVTLWDTLEHAPSPPQLLADCVRLLVPGGHLIVQSPHGHGLSARLLRGRWWVLGPADHLVMFSPGALGAALAGAGLEVLALYTRQLSPPYAPHEADPARPGMRLFHQLTGRELVERVLTRLDLGDWVFAVARKRGQESDARAGNESGPIG